MRALPASALLATFLLHLHSAAAQTGDLPPSFTDPTVVPLTSVDLERVSAVGTAAQTAAEQAVPDEWRSEPFALSQKCGFSTTTSGTWETVAAGQIWRLRVQALGAAWMTVGFGTFRIPAGAKLWVYDAAQGQLQGPWESDDVLDHGQRWSHPLDGDTFVLELFWPTAQTGVTPNIHLTRCEVGFKPLFPVDEDCDGDCNPDISCPQGFDVSVIKRGMVRIKSALGPWPFPCDQGIEQCESQCMATNECYLNATANCSGTLINTTANDCRQYVLTAGHCVEDQGAFAGSSFLFNYEREPCCTGPTPTTFWVDNGTVLAEWDGLVGDPNGGDMALVRIDDEIPLAYDARFNGWSRSASPAPGFTSGIHQPSGAKSKKIALALGGYVSVNSRYWRVEDWDVGAPRDGSSGSPLFNSALRVVGWLSSGPQPPPCPGFDDNYGRFDRGWTGGGNAGARLRDWLDPAQTDAISIPGRDDGTFASCKLLPWPSVISAGTGGGGIGAGPVPGETAILRVPLENMGSTTLNDLSGTLTSLTPGVTVVRDQATWPDIAGFGSAENDPPHFAVEIDPSVPCGAEVSLGTTISDPGFGIVHPGVFARLGEETVNILPGFDVFTSSSLVGTNSWMPDSTDDTPLGPRWFISDIASRSDTVLVTPQIVSLPADARLKFRHMTDTENTYDGGVLEYSTDGTTWLDAGPLMTAGAYVSGFGGGVSADLRGRDAWAGDSDGWRDVEVDLSGLVGQNLQFRFRFATDTSGGDVGWWIDDAILEYSQYTCSPPSPGAVPDGSQGVPMRVEKLDPDGSELRVHYDDATCLGAVGHHIVFGEGSQLPDSLTGTYPLSGSVCGIGATSPFDWSRVPDPVAGAPEFVWWLLLADDGATTEGSWGLNGGGLERAGPGTDGASDECGFLVKDPSNACGQ